MRKTAPDIPEEPPREQRAVQSVEVGGRLLLAMAEHPAPMTLKDLAAQAGLPPSRAHPYLVSYGKLGLVQQDATSGRYALGPAALRIGLTCLFQLDPIKAALPVAEALAASTGQAVALAVWGNFGPTVVRLIEARQPLHVAMRAGTVMAMFGTATGRAFVGALPRERLLQALGGPLGGANGGAHGAALDGLASGGPQVGAHAGAARRRARPGAGRTALAWRDARRRPADPRRQRLQRAGARPRGRGGAGHHHARPPGPFPLGLDLADGGGGARRGDAVVGQPRLPRAGGRAATQRSLSARTVVAADNAAAMNLEDRIRTQLARGVVGLPTALATAVGLVMASPVILTATTGFSIGGSSFVIAMLIAVVLMFLQATTFAEAATMMPTAGSVYDYIACGLGRVAAITGTISAYMLVHAFAGTAETILAG